MQLAAVQDDIGKRRKILKLLEERLKVAKEDSSPVDATVGPDTISSLHGKKSTPISTSIAEAATNTA
jgi:stress response protein YsnF